jgi:hypothetical protein
LAIPTKMFLAPFALMIFLAFGSSPSNSAAVGAEPATGCSGLAASVGAGAGEPEAAGFLPALPAFGSGPGFWTGASAAAAGWGLPLLRIWIFAFGFVSHRN